MWYVHVTGTGYKISQNRNIFGAEVIGADPTKRGAECVLLHYTMFGKK